MSYRKKVHVLKINESFCLGNRLDQQLRVTNTVRKLVIVTFVVLYVDLTRPVPYEQIKHPISQWRHSQMQGRFTTFITSVDINPELHQLSSKVCLRESCSYVEVRFTVRVSAKTVCLLLVWEKGWKDGYIWSTMGRLYGEFFGQRDMIPYRPL